MSRGFTWFPMSSLGVPNIYQNLGYFTRMWDFTWRVSDCEELVGEVNHTTESGTDLAKSISNCINYGFIVFPFTFLYRMFPFLSR